MNPRIAWLLNRLNNEGVKWDVVLPDGTHLYWCTGHRHGYGDHCGSTKNVHGEPKEPGQCKWCEATCPGRWGDGFKHEQPDSGRREEPTRIN